MRKRLLLSLIMMVLLVTTVTVAMAADKSQVNLYDQQKQLVKSVVFVVGHDQYFVNGQTPGVKMDARPFVEKGRTFVPVRYLSNALGVDDEHIGWEEKTKLVTLKQPGFPVVELVIGSKTIKSDGKATTMDVAPQAKQGRTYLPARWVAEALGYQVDWLPENNIVLCYPSGAEKPDISKVVEHITGQVPVTPVEQPVTGETRPFSGKPLNPDNYVTYDGWAIPYEFKLPGASIMEITVDELRQKPVKMGEGKGYTIVYDVNVQKDKVYVKQSTSDLTPAVLVLAKGNDVSVQRDNALKEYDSNPFTHGYYVSLEADPGGGTKIEDVTHIMLLYSNQVLAVKNPLYKGGNK